jgi:hypothetical protein
MNNQSIACHKNAPFTNGADFTLEWTEKRHGNYPSPYSHCSYCGSIHFDDIRKVLAEGGKLGGSDWKYGYPHKFYVYPKDGSMLKFYTAHIQDLKDEEFTEFAVLLKTYTGIEFSKDEQGNVMYHAPYHGYQR